MAKTRKQKTSLIETYKELLDNGNFVIVNLSTKVPAQAMNMVRLIMSETGGKVYLLKNKVFTKVASGYQGLEDLHLEGIMALISADEDLVSALKTFEKITDFAKSELTLRGEDEEFIKKYKAFDYALGYMDGQVLGKQDAAKLSSLPSKEQLYGQMAGLFANTIKGFMHVLNGNTLNLMYALQDLREKKSSESNQ